MISLKPAALFPRSGGKLSAAAIATILFDTLPPFSFILFAWAQAGSLFQAFRISVLLILAKAVLELRFYVRNSTAPFVRTSYYAWLIGLGGTVAPLMLRPNIGVPDFFLGTLIQIIGLALLIHLIVTLNRGAGPAMAESGVGRRGLYCLVRHPLSLAFMICHVGYVMNHTTPFNVGILAIAIFLQLLRVNEEERLLEDDDQFQEYAYQTRWKVIPGMY